MNQNAMTVEPFCKEKVVEMIRENKVDDVKSYIKTYFFKVLKPVCIIFNNIADASLDYLTDDEFSRRYITSSMTIQHIIGNKVNHLSYSSWFRNDDTDDYYLEFDVSKPRFRTEGTVKYLNMFNGFRFANDDKPKVTTKLRDGIKYIWNHMYEVICSNDDAMFSFLKNWMCHFLSGRKMKTVPYLRGVQGAGKSTLGYFLILLIGKMNVYKTTSPSCLTGRFNGELQGKILLVLEELRCQNASDWKVMNSTLNGLATEDTISIECKGKDAINIKNNLSMIITSNDSPIKVDKNDRRYFMADISTSKVGDAKYFKQLYEYLDNETIQKIFYHEAVQFAKENKFQEEAELRKLESNVKAEVMIKNLHPVYTYIREKYILKRKPFNVFLKHFTDDFNLESGTKLMPIEVSRLLKEANVIGKTSTGNLLRYKYEADEILEVFKKNKWIHEDDEFEEEQESSDAVDYVETKAALKRQVSELQEQVKELQEQLKNKQPIRKTVKKIVKVKNDTNSDDDEIRTIVDVKNKSHKAILQRL